ncbi:enoyl-CoA hydratase/isomerase family protein [Halobacillus amylolyticus]|uniref:Enoyl-CoA hydratase-related protein n=1 Tax=Halobacillus amylolyticus TaxID=2932259 RepID=A0ABY4H9E2_9BACI|nr:enoyl-CoA hydratase-related protein [Halobacillus amylolyticus]UOR11498.1 enoyl-CoA hydratase-related protein [Halobacillus amylolyticus]
MPFENIELTTKDQLAYITINRPEARNALNKETLDEMVEALGRVAEQEEVGAVVFTGKGEKSFAAGADIKQLTEKSALDALNPQGMQYVYDRIESYEKPTIAMINGYALGGGCELAMACDIRVASTNAKLGLPELNLSIIPGAGGTQRLARLVGKGKALEMILTGKMMDAQEAVQFGLVSEAVAPEDLAARVEEVASTILSKGPLAVKLAKLSVHMGTETDMKTGLMLEKLSQAILFNSDDKNEGTQAFIEKRKAVFQGK